MHPLSEMKHSGCSSVRLECLLWEQEVVGSNPVIPTQRNCHAAVSFFIRQNGIRFLKADYFSEELYGCRDAVIIKYSLFDLSHIKVYTLKGKYICTAKRVEPIHPLANYTGEVKDIEDLKQKTKLQKKLAKQTELAYIQRLKRENAYLPLQDLNLEEYRQEQKLIEVSKEIKNEDKNNNGIFNRRFERYEYLQAKNNLTEKEKLWMKDYEKSEEYQQIYSNSKVINI